MSHFMGRLQYFKLDADPAFAAVYGFVVLCGLPYIWMVTVLFERMYLEYSL